MHSRRYHSAYPFPRPFSFTVDAHIHGAGAALHFPLAMQRRASSMSRSRTLTSGIDMYEERRESSKRRLSLSREGWSRETKGRFPSLLRASVRLALLEQTDTEVRPRSCANVRNEVVQGQPMPRFSSRLPPSASSVHKV